MIKHQYEVNNHTVLIILAILFIFIAIPRIIFPDLDHGDEYTDANVLDAGKNFIKFGFRQSRFLPNTDINLSKPNNPYLHYPPLPEIINGALRALFKSDSLYLFRGVSLFLSLLGILFWYLAVQKITGSYLVGFLAAIFYLSNPYFIYGIDSLHESCYSEFLRSLVIFIFISIPILPQKRRIILVTLWALVLLESLITFEYIIFLSLFFMLFQMFYKERNWKLSKAEIMILLSAPVFGFLLHFLQNAWYFNSFTDAFLDFKSIAIQRIAGSQDAMPINMFLWLRYVILRNLSMVFLFSYKVLFLAVFFSYFLYQKLSLESRRVLKQLLYLFFIFFICGISWYIVFPSHSWAHAFVGFLVRHLLPVASLGFAIFCYNITRYIKENMGVRQYANIVFVLIVIIIFVAGIKNSQLPVTAEKIKYAREFVNLKECLLNLKEISQPYDTLAVNYYRYPFIRYYTNRHSVRILDKTSLESTSCYPRYFIFIPYNNQDAYYLFNFLKQKYSALWQCDSVTFPAIFFKLND